MRGALEDTKGPAAHWRPYERPLAIPVDRSRLHARPGHLKLQGSRIAQSPPSLRPGAKLSVRGGLGWPAGLGGLSNPLVAATYAITAPDRGVSTRLCLVGLDETMGLELETDQTRWRGLAGEEDGSRVPKPPRGSP